MRIEIDKDWFEANKAIFEKQGKDDMGNEDKEYLVIDTDEQDIFNQENIDNFEINELNEISFTVSDVGIYVTTPNIAIDSGDIKNLLKNSDTEATIFAIEHALSKLEKMKDLLKSAQAI